MSKPNATTARIVQVGILAWLLPGAGHYLIGQKRFAMIFFLAISFPYLTGVAIGGVKNSVDPKANKWLFYSELGIGSYTTLFYALNRAIGEITEAQVPKYVSIYPAVDVAQIYLAVAGLLNVLAILDALTRAQTNGQPVFYHEVASSTGPPGGDG